MDLREIALRRLRSQRLVGPSCRSTADAVRWLGAVQSQDFAGARWSVAMRCGDLDGAAFDRAFDSGRVLRTHVMRPTWHLVPAEDLHWMQRLTAARVHPANAHQCRKFGIDAATLTRSRACLEKALAGGRFRTREELAEVFTRRGIAVDGPRLVCLLIDAELEAVICSGPRRDGRFTYALAGERAAKRVDLRGDEALTELGWRYFRSHGPASAKDFAWWSGSTVSVARRAIEANASRLERCEIKGVGHWHAVANRPRRSSKTVAHLVSVFDEHLVAYRNHDYSFSPEARRAVSAGNLARLSVILLDGVIVGSWVRKPRASKLEIQATLFPALTPLQRTAIEAAAERVGRFAGRPVALELLGAKRGTRQEQPRSGRSRRLRRSSAGSPRSPRTPTGTPSGRGTQPRRK